MLREFLRFRMNVFGRLKTGLVLTKDSLLIMRHNPKLALFPLVSGAAGLAFLAVFLGVTFGLMAIDPQGGALVGLFLAYLVLTFVSSFFTAGLVHQTREALAGNEPSLRSGIAAAWDVKAPLFVWALVSATVGVVINAIENSDSRIARVFGAIFGIAWTLLTFFVIPVIVFEKTSIKGMFVESARNFKETWGETPISLFGVQAISTLVALPFLGLGYVLLSVSTVAAVGVILAGVVLWFLVGQTLQGIIKTTLYVYATDGAKPGEFDDVDFDGLSESTTDPSRTDTSPTTGRI